jgi:1,4-dihydroxy-2-naphthoate octaprenyltransferase
MISTIAEYIIATRPWSFTAAIIPVLVTTAATNSSFLSDGFIRALVMGVAVQAGANLTNTYFDFLNGVDTKHTPTGEKTLVERKISTTGALVVSLLCYVIGVSAVLPVFLERMDTQALVILAVGILLAFFYTANPVGLKYKALGDVTIFLTFGPLLMQCTSLLVSGKMDSNLYVYAAPVGLLTEAILHANNARDIKNDSQAGALTLAIILGFEWSYYFYVLLIVGAYASVVWISLFQHWGCAASFLTLPLAMALLNDFKGEKMLNLAEDTAKAHLPFGVLMVLGIILTPNGLLA